MSKFNNRIFGVNIHPSVKNKLKAKQIFANSPNPNESLQSTSGNFTYLDKLGNEEPLNISVADALGGINFPTTDGKGSMFDLSSRTLLIN